MGVVEVLAVFVGGPVVVFAIAYVLAVRGTPGGSSPNRYKLGQPWSGPPLWFTGRPRTGVVPQSGAPQLTAGARPATGGTPTVVGGASGSW